MDHSIEIHSLAYFSYSVDDALAVLRILGPAEYAQLQVLPGIDSEGLRLEAIHQADVVVVQRDVCQDYTAYQTILSTARAQHKAVVFDLDDLLFMLPEDHPDRQSGYYVKALLPILQALIEADLVTVATEALKQQLLPFNANIAVIPNYLNDRLWKLREITVHERQEQTVTIGYMGSQTHRPDVEMVLPALVRLQEKYGERIQFKFWGVQPPEALFKAGQVQHDPQTLASYIEFARFFQTQTADIVIAPLRDNLFNACKSPIKYLEYGALGIPGVYSDIEPYARIIRHGEDGLLAASVENWVEMLSLLIDQPDLGVRIAQNAQAKIRQSWLLSDHYQHQVAAYLRAGHSEHRVPELAVYRSIASQSYEEALRYKRILSESASNLDENRLALDAMKVKLEEFNQKLADANQKLADGYQKLDERNRQLAESNFQRDEGYRKIEELNQTLGEYLAQINENQGIMSEVSAGIDERNQAVQALNAQLLETRKEMAHYLASKSWRYTRIFRKILGRLRRLFYVQ